MKKRSLADSRRILEPRSIAWRVGALLSIALFTVPGFGLAGTFHDDFVTFDTAVWEPWSVGGFTGATPTLTPMMLDGRTVVDFSSLAGGNGTGIAWWTRDSFTATNVRLEAVFKTLGPVGQSIDGLMWLFLVNESTGYNFEGHFFFGGYGADRGVGFCPNIPGASCEWYNRPPGIDYNRWYRMVFDITCTTAVMRLYDDVTNALVWQSVTFPFGLFDLGPGEYRIAIGQSFGTPGGGTWIAHSAIDRIDAVMTDGTCPPPACAPLPANMISWWPGENTANDTIGGLNGTLHNGATFGAGKVGQAFQFDGSNDYVRVADTPALRPSSQLSLEAWFNLNAPNSAGMILVEKGDANGAGYGIYLCPGQKLGFLIRVAGGLQGGGWSTSITTAQWYHVALTFDAGAADRSKLYVNGVEVPTSAISCIGNSDAAGNVVHDGSALYFGMRLGAILPFNGRIDEVAIYNRALTPAEVAASYAAGRTGHCVPVVVGTVSGVVTADGSPLSGVTVNLSASEGHTDVTQTNLSGAYSFLDVPEGPAQVSVALPAGYEAVQPADGTASVTVTGGGTTTQDFTLAGFGAVTGEVLGDGGPLSGVTVELTPASGPPLSDITEPDGTYGFARVPVGQAQVSVVAPSGYEAIAPAGGTANVAVTANGTTAQDFSLAGFGTVSGIVLGNGAPLGGITVNLAPANGPALSDVTEPDGTYAFAHVPVGEAEVSVVVPSGYVAASPMDGVATVTVVAGVTTAQDFVLTGFGNLTGTVSAGGSPLANVTVDLVADGDQFIQFATTNGSGVYAFTGVPVGPANVSIVIPLGYLAVDPEAGAATVTVVAGQTVVRNFTLELLPDAGPSRTIGYWKHQVNVHMTGRGTAQESLVDMSTTFPTRIFDHFYQNQLNSIDVEEVTFLPGPIPMTLEAMHATLNLRNAAMVQRAKQQYLALLLNVASNRLRSTDVVSADGARASQAIQQIAAEIKDGDPSNDEAAKDVADTINNGAVVPAGVINLAIPVIPFAPHPNPTPGVAGMARMRPNPIVRDATLEFEMMEAGRVTVAVYDTAGRRVRTLVDGALAVGQHAIPWDGRAEDASRTANGVYFCRIATASRVMISKFVVMR